MQPKETKDTTQNRTADYQTVLIAGATGYLGRFLVAEYHQRNWRVIALVRNLAKAQGKFPEGVQVVQAQITQPETLEGIMNGNIDLVVSTVGITRQKDGLTYRDVDYRANQHLLDCAVQAKVPHFCYIHVLHGESMSHLPAIQPKQGFVNALHQAVADGNLQHATVVAPCGFFSDMRDFFYMARSGRAYLFGDGQCKINPIHGADLARATADAVNIKQERLDVGGPDVFTQQQLVALAFDVLQKPVRVTLVWDWIRTFLIQVLPWVSPLTVYGPAQFFLTAMGRDMVGECRGTHHLMDYFADIFREEEQQKRERI